MQCKRCGKALPSAGFICRNCGTLFDTEQIKEQKDRINQENRDKIYKLNEFLPDGTPRTYLKTNNRTNKNKAIGIVIILVALGIIAAIALINLLK